MRLVEGRVENIIVKREEAMKKKTTNSSLRNFSYIVKI